MNTRSSNHRRLLAGAAFLAATSLAHAAPNPGSLPDKSCYDSHGLAQARPAPERLLLIGIDQTTLIPEALEAKLIKMITAALRPGDEVVFVSFSAYSRDRYVREEASLRLEAPLSKEVKRRMPVSAVPDMLHCLDLQQIGARHKVAASVKAALEKASASIKYSEILSALQALGQRLSSSPAKEKILLLVSDGLEHSRHTTTFYDNKSMRVIDPAVELQAVQAKGLKVSLAGARVYFFGGGLIANDDGYRNQLAINRLATFWSLFIAASGGSLQEFGAPEVQGPIR